MKKTQVIIVSVFGLLVLLVIWTISAMKGKEENQNTVRLSTDNKDVTITDVKAQLERTPPCASRRRDRAGTIRWT